MTGRIVGAVGAISGTSMDGIDVARLETDGESAVRPGPGRTYDYDPVLKTRLLEALRDPSIAERDPLTPLDEAVTDAHVQAIERFMREEAIAPSSIAYVGLHGQTIYHRPERRFTRQFGIGARAAKRLRLPVVSRFRHEDVAAGGQGAPFAPLYHAALTHGLVKPLMVLNLGGVANVTYLDADAIIAFDTGPASALLDDFMRRRRGLPFDEGGRLAASGTPDRAVLARLMDNPFLALAPPKSLDRNDFHARATIVETLDDATGAATLAAFTVESVAAALAHVPRAPRRWLVTGGGRRNRAFMATLARRLGVPVDPVEAVGWNGDAIEAQCFAYLAVRSIRGLPLSLPSTTGVPRPMQGGQLDTPA
jgi:anhydro-N-acetylmuramic acid kinase